MSGKPCNHCIYKKVKERAEKEGKAFTTLKDACKGGMHLFIHPTSVQLRLFKDNDAVLGEHHVVWLDSALTKHCTCDDPQ